MAYKLIPKKNGGSNFHEAYRENFRGYRTYLCNCMPNIYLRKSGQMIIPTQVSKGRKRITRGFMRRCPGFKR